MKKNIYIMIVLMASISIGCTSTVNKENLNTEQLPVKTQEIAATPQSGKTITISMRSPKTLNPLLNEDITVDNVLKLIFEPLFLLDEYQKPTPNIAESIELTSDGMSAIIKLKQNIKWHDGELLIANDVVFSLNTIRNSSDLTIYKNTMRNISTFSAIDDYNLKINFIQPFVGSLYLLNFPVIPAHYYVANNEQTNLNPIGNGAYKFISFENVKEMNLEKNDAFFKGNPLIDKVKVITTPDLETDMYSFDQGVIDEVSSNVLDLASYNAKNDTGVSEFVTSYYDLIGFNFNNTTLNDKNIRKAIAHAVPKNEIVQSIYLGHAIEAETPINPQSWASEPKTVNYGFDLDLSKELIETAGFLKDANGDLSKSVEGNISTLNFRILVNTENQERIKIATILKDNLESIGMKLEIISVPYEEYKEKIKQRDFDLCVAGYNMAVIPDLTFLLHSSNIENGSNIFAYNNEEMNAKITKVFVSKTDADIKTSLSELQIFISEELPCISVVFRKSAVLTNKRIYGEISPTTNNIYANINKWFVYEDSVTEAVEPTKEVTN